MFKKFAKAMIRFYKLAISPILPPSCKYFPTCSDYTAEAIEAHGVTYGSFMGLKRILRCHPFSKGGFDPVDESMTKKSKEFDILQKQGVMQQGPGEKS